MVKLRERHIQLTGRQIWHFPLGRPTSSPAIPYYSSSLYILGIYALRVTHISSWGRAFKWFAASAERKCIFRVEKLMNPALFRCFSWFSYFLNFGRFWGALALNLDSVAWFPARSWSKIARARNIKPIQIFAFICYSCADLTSYQTTLNILPFDTRLKPSDAKYSFV